MNNFVQSILDAEKGKTHLFFLGQAGFIIKSRSEKIIGYDMYLSDCVYQREGKDGLQRLLPQILAPNDIQFDYIVTSHAHRDHFDEDVLPQLMANKKTKLFASISCKNDTEQLHIAQSQCTFVKPYDTHTCDDIEFHFVPCDHGTGAPDAVGLVLIVDGKKIYFTGDTCLRLDRNVYFETFAQLDVLIAPINGAWGNLNENDCATLSGALHPKITIPCHYGMFAMHGGNPNTFKAIMRNQYSKNKFIILNQGDYITL